MPISIPSATEISAGFDHLKGTQTRGVYGVKEFKSPDCGPSDPRVYIGVCTHGDERVGAGLVVPFLKGRDGGIELRRGSIVVAVNNLLAATTGDLGMRAVPGDMNYNRLPRDIVDGKRWTSETPAVVRIRELYRAGFFNATHGTDNHTYVGPGEAMKLHIKGDLALGRAVGIRDYITDIVPATCAVTPGGNGLAFGNFIGGVENEGVPVVEFEGGGPHSNPEVIQGLIHGTVAMLAQLDMIDPDLVERGEFEQAEYRVGQYYIVPDGYMFVAGGGNFGEVEERQVLAVDAKATSPQRPFSSPPIVSALKGHHVMPPLAGQVVQGMDDGWISAPVVKTTQPSIRARLAA